MSRTDGKRLSTCALKYRNPPFNMTDKQFYKSILNVCPHIVRTQFSNLGYMINGNGFEKRGWIQQNCEGYWYDTTDMYYDRRKTVKTAKVIYLFQHNDEAIQFKLIWG